MIRYLNGISFIFFTLSGPSHPAYAPLQRTQLELRFSAAGQAPEPQAQLGEVDLKVDRTLAFQATIAIVSMTTYPLHHTINDSDILLNGFYLK